MLQSVELKYWKNLVISKSKTNNLSVLKIDNLTVSYYTGQRLTEQSTK